MNKKQYKNINNIPSQQRTPLAAEINHAITMLNFKSTIQNILFPRIIDHQFIMKVIIKLQDLFHDLIKVHHNLDLWKNKDSFYNNC